MKATINSLVTTVDHMATVVNSLTTAVNNNLPRDQTVKELDFQERKFKDCIYKAIQYYKTNDSAAQGVSSNWNALEIRIINPPPKYNVEYVKTKVTDYFLSLDLNELHGIEDPDVPREKWFKMWGNLAYDNTFHIIKKFLIYLGERFGANGVTWKALKSNIKSWKQAVAVLDGEAGIPTQSGRHFELTVPVLVAPLYLAVDNWMVREMVCSLMGNARKHLIVIYYHFSATSEQPVVPTAREQSAVSVSLEQTIILLLFVNNPLSKIAFSNR
ncbi:uncharacterized protein EV154DRAFT_480255 [Mucor mucedo]|uniref:uncharacterized protein n=1 Tax=Mucor mucedo TaxID=29922 RepID=UPI00221FB2CC|nr:uncharacterized protein EV154DRAFT_480255 [Mucor mucedo]KAI7892529.1 hypothetical protein EV154DRAFT_480255 [Mucor mucedo]